MKTALGLPCSVERDIARQPQRGRRLCRPPGVNTSPPRSPDTLTARSPSRDVVVGGGRAPSRSWGRDRVGGVNRAVDRARRKARHRRAWTNPEIAVHHARTRVRDRRAGKDGETTRRAETHRRLRRADPAREDQ